jgi:hemolysin activation/secretion protein
LTAEDGVSLGFEEEQVVQPHADVVEARLENTSFGLERVTLDDPFAPARGTRVSFEATQSFKRETLRPEGETTARASAAEMHGEYIRPLSRTSGLSLGLEGAGRFSSEPVLPVFERYPLGGAASLRGYDEEAFRVDRYLLSHLEWRVYIGTPRQRFITFWDHAWTATRVRDAAGTLLWDTFQKDGVGFGLRVDTAAGLVSVDYGLAAGRPPIEGKIHLRLISTF